MALKIDTKSKEKLTCASKKDVRNLVNFHQSTFESLNIGTFIEPFYPSQKMYELKIYRGIMSHENEERCKI